MNAHVGDVLAEALTLSGDKRAELVTELLASLDGSADADADAAWAREIEQRAERARAGEATDAVEWSVARQRMVAALRRR